MVATVSAKLGLATALAVALSSCGDDAAQPTAARYSDYRLDLPADFVRDETAVPIDSKAESWIAPDAEIWTDFGQYGGTMKCADVGGRCSTENREVDGKPAVVTRFGPDAQRLYGLHIYVPLDVVEASGRRWPLSLVMGAQCRTQARCDALLPVLLSARLVEGSAAWENVGRPAPPPPAPPQ